MLSFQPLILAAFLASADAGLLRSARRLSEKLIAGFEPKTDVTDHARVDLDLAYMGAQFKAPTTQSFSNARRVYQEGAHSKVVARVDLIEALGVDLQKGDTVTGVSTEGKEVVLKAYASYEAANDLKEIKLQYISLDCNVGGLPTTAQNIDGCLANTGTLVVSGTAVEYSYDQTNKEDNSSGRSLQGFSTSANKKMRPDQDTDPFFNEFAQFNAYYGDTDYADKFVLAAFTGSSTGFTNAKANFDFTEYDGDLVARAELIKKGTGYMTVAMYVLRELEDAIWDCNQGCDREDCNDDAVHALDEAVAFFAGSLEDVDGSGDGVMVYALGDKRSRNFKTGGAAGDAVEGTSKANIDIFREFNNMAAKLVQKDCDAALVHRVRIGQLIFVPMIQGALRYAYLTATDPEASTKAEAEGVAFAAAVLPLVATCSQSAASTIHTAMKPSQPHSEEDFANVKKAFEDNYACMKVSCADVGGLWDDANKVYFEGAEPCGDGANTGNSSTSNPVNVGLAVGLSVGGLFAVLLVCLFCKYRKGKSGVEFKTDENAVSN